MKHVLYKRIWLALPLFLGVSLIGFFVMQAAPGDPLARLLLNPHIEPGDLQHIRQSWGLDRPLWQQYFYWLGAWVRGDWGFSFYSGSPVRELVMGFIPNSLILIGIVLCLAFPAAIAYGLLTFSRSNMVTYSLEALASLILSTPTFVTGLLLIFLFSEKWQLLPSSSMYSAHGSQGTIDLLQHAVMPALALALPLAASWGKVYEVALQNSLAEPHVQGAVIRGVPWRRILWAHIMYNAWLPLLTMIAIDLPVILTGAVVVETLFAWPGIGQLYAMAAADRDYPVLMTILVLVAMVTVTANLVADLVSAWLDPRRSFMQNSGRSQL